MKKRKWSRKVAWIFGVTAVCTLGLVLLKTGHVFGKYSEESIYLQYTGDTDSEPVKVMDSNDVFVTDEGGNKKGSQGTGATPLNDKVPTCVGTKGTDSNPFIILEIVPDKAMQQMIYLNPDNNKYPFDVMQIGIDASKAKNASITEQNMDNYNIKDLFGNWMVDFNYDIYSYEDDVDKGNDKEKKSVKMIYTGKYYTVKLNSDQITEDDYNNLTVPQLAKKYPDLFKKDLEGEAIRDISLTDKYNWTKKKKTVGSEVHYEKSVTSDKLTFRQNQNQWNYSSANLVEDNQSVLAGSDDQGNAITDEAKADYGNWSVNKTDSKDYSYTISTPSIADEDYQSVKDEKMTIEQLAVKYPSLFRLDSTGKAVEAARLSDDKNWQISKEANKEVLDQIYGGYVYYVGAGKGDYALQDEWSQVVNANISKLTVSSDSSQNQWKYVTDVTQIPADRKELTSNDNFWQYYKDTGYYIPVSVYESKYGRVIMQSKFTTVYTVKYNASIQTYEFNYDKGDKKSYYTYCYYNLKANEVLKRSLFKFNNEKDCKNFNLQVVCVTPDELNKMSKDDTSATVDMVERADMVYISSFHKTDTSNIKNVYELYHKFWMGEKDYDFNQEADFPTFETNDLEWDLCVKIMKRISTNKNLPLVWTQKVGSMLRNGVDGNSSSKETTMYMSKDCQNYQMNGALNNVAKLYLVSIQFDLLARHSDGVKRSFMEDILPYIQTVKLKSTSGINDYSAKTTGYYVRPLATSDSISDFNKKKSYYLWNALTFYPAELGGNQNTNLGVDKYVEYGYSANFFDTNNQNQPFTAEGVSYTHHSGTDGEDEKNVTLVSDGSNSNENHSTLITPSGSEAIISKTLDIIYKIMNNSNDKVAPLTVQVLKQKKLYTRLDEVNVLIDYNKDSKYKTNDTMYLRVKVSNVNDQTGAILGTVFIKPEDTGKDKYSSSACESHEPALLTALGTTDLTKVLYREYADSDTTILHKQKVADEKGTQWADGYPVSTDVTFYVPYKLKDWQNGYTVLRVYTQGRVYNTKKNLMVQGEEVYTDITISARDLFNLQ